MSLVISGKLVAQSPVFVGSGGKEYGFTDANLQLVRLPIQGKWLPYIPASSLKGVFRSRAEVLLRKAGKRVCNIFGEENCGQRAEDIKEWEKEAKSPDEVFKKYVNHKVICDACKIFGLPGYHSLVRFTNAAPTEEHCFDTQTMIAIKPGRTTPRTLEYIKPGTSFNFLIEFRRFDERIAWAAGLLLTIINEVNEGIIQFGGQRTRGYGWCRIEVADPPQGERQRLVGKWEEYAKSGPQVSP